MDSAVSEEISSSDSSPQGGGGGASGVSAEPPRVQRKITNLENGKGGSKAGGPRKDEREIEKNIWEAAQRFIRKTTWKWRAVIEPEEFESHAGEEVSKAFNKLKELYLKEPDQCYAYLNRVLPLRMNAVVSEILQVRVAESLPQFTVKTIRQKLKEGDRVYWKIVEEECSELTFKALKMQMEENVFLKDIAKKLEIKYGVLQVSTVRDLKKIGFRRVVKLNRDLNEDWHSGESIV